MPSSGAARGRWASASRGLAGFVAGFFLLLAVPALACEGDRPCDPCTKGDKGWNPGDGEASPALIRFYRIEEELKAAEARQDDEAVRRLAGEYLERAAEFRCNWNHGNAVHDANRHLGLASLRAGDKAAASRFLALAGRSPGSPQLDSFGPDLDLANALLKAGEVEAVRAYLKDIQRFWKMDRGTVADWLEDIDQGKKPELDRFAAMRPGFWAMSGGAFFALTPFLVAIAFAARAKLPRASKFLLFVLGSIAGYLVFMGVLFGFVWFMQAESDNPDSLLFRHLMPSLGVALALALALPALAVHLVHRRLRAAP